MDDEALEADACAGLALAVMLIDAGRVNAEAVRVA
jgi:hypothetical protein